MIKILTKAEDAKSDQDSIKILDKVALIKAFEWNFSARDFDNLITKVPLFQMLMRGKRSFKEMYYIDGEYQVSSGKFNIFKEVFFSVIARIASSESVATMQIKKSGMTSIPGVSRRQSVLNQSSSE